MFSIRQDYLFRKTLFKARLYLLRTAGIKRSCRVLRLDSKPIVIGGCGRSGTTFLLSILSCHPKIITIESETRALSPGTIDQPMYGAPFKYQRIYEELLSHPIPDSCERWCEKTPRNVLHFERILHHLGKNVRIIHIVRDGRDVVTSRHPTDPTRYWVSPDRWVWHVSQGHKVEGHPQVLRVRYEDLILSYEPTMRMICDFLDEEFVDEFITYPKCAKIREDSAWFSGARPITAKSIGRWKKEEFREVISQFMNTPGAAELLKEYGYLK